MTYRYEKAAHDFDDSLSTFLTELEGEAVIKEAVEREMDDGLRRITSGKTPLDEVREIIDSKTKKTAGEELREYGIRKELRKLAARSREAVDNFLTAAKGG